jgi:predicted cupin superfamily sugar epimerase
MNPQAQARAQALGLSPHPEGGWFRETFRSPEQIRADALPARFGGDRALVTSILYLLGDGERSCFHRLHADEVWSHHEGGALLVHLLQHDGLRTLTVGPGTPQQVVPHGTWFAAELAAGADYGLAGCAVAPGFEYADFELARRDALLIEYPSQREIVLRFTRTPEEPAWP